MSKGACCLCKGKKKILCECTEGRNTKFADKYCPECRGKGIIICPECNGTGRGWEIITNRSEG